MESAKPTLGPAVQEYIERVRPRLRTAMLVSTLLVVVAAIGWLAGLVSFWVVLLLGLLRMGLPFAMGIGSRKHHLKDMAGEANDESLP